MKWREVREADLAECLAIEPRHLGDEIVGPRKALEIWRDLIRSRSFNSAVIESVEPGSGSRIVAFGCGVFVTPAFAAWELDDPRPGINSRLFASIASGNSVVRSPAELSPGEGEDGLDLVNLYGDYRADRLRPDQMDEVRTALANSFLEALAGYHLNRVLIETTGEAQRTLTESAGVFRTVQSFPDERTLMLVNRQTAYSVFGSIAQSLFQFEAPVLALHDTDKHLLAEALGGGTDGELAARLNISHAAVKKRWSSLFERVEKTRPDLLPEPGSAGAADARGPQKRHRILTYVRAHPSELRPFRWRAADESALSSV
jgi:hypothetical protein